MAKLYEIDYMQIGERLKSIREKKGKSLSDVAELLKCNERTVRNYESGQAVPLTKLLMFCNELECDMGYLLGEYDESNKDIAFICKETGLSEKTIEYLKENQDIRKGREEIIPSLSALFEEEHNHAISYEEIEQDLQDLYEEDVAVRFLDYFIPRIDRVTSTIREIIIQNEEIEEYKQDGKKFDLILKVFNRLNENFIDEPKSKLYRTVILNLLRENNGRFPDDLTDEHIIKLAEKICEDNNYESVLEMYINNQDLRHCEDWKYVHSFRVLENYNDKSHRKIQEFIISDTFLDIVKEYINNR